MGLDGLVSRPVAGYVKGLTLLGTFKEHKEDEYEKGRIPDNTMMLNIVIRAAIDRTDKLEVFYWSLNSSPMKTVYQGLAGRTTLTKLTLRFPSSRIPRPTTTIPGIPSLKYLHLIGMDPLCYNDDGSLLLLEARKLETLKLEWSPRMRREREPSVLLSLLFGRCFEAGLKIPVKHYAMKNLFARKEVQVDSILDFESLESLTTINCMDPHEPGTIFVDRTWMLHPKHETFTKVKKIRIDRFDERRAEPLTVFEKLEEIYLINRNPRTDSRTVSIGSMAMINGISAPASPNTPLTPVSNDHPKQLISIGSEYLAAISSRHGKTLKKLLLSDRWYLSGQVLKNLLIDCPHVEQLGVAVEENFDALESLEDVAPNLKALRILIRQDSPLWQTIKDMDIDTHCFGIGHQIAQRKYNALEWLGVGDLYFHIGEMRQVTDPKTGAVKPVRLVRPVGWETIKHVEIWGQDTLEL